MAYTLILDVTGVGVVDRDKYRNREMRRGRYGHTVSFQKQNGIDRGKKVKDGHVKDLTNP